MTPSRAAEAAGPALLESVPNFSGPLEAPAGMWRVLDADFDPHHNRTVVTLAGGVDVVDDVLRLIAHAVERLDLRAHRGVHPRVGVADVVPLVPLRGLSLDDCARLARDLAERVWRELGVPAFLYGAAGRWTLPQIRRGQAAPDVGDRLHPTAGACCIGARLPLVAYNVLVPDGLAAATELARRVRATSAHGIDGVQALAFDLPHSAQLSMNLVGPAAEHPAGVVEQLTAMGVSMGADEVVGLIPAGAALAGRGLPAAAGRLLETHAAATCCVGAAGLCREVGTREMELLAARFDAAAVRLRATGIDADALLATTELVATIPRVLPESLAAEPAGREVVELATWAAGELVGAVPVRVALKYPERMAALARWGVGGG